MAFDVDAGAPKLFEHAIGPRRRTRTTTGKREQYQRREQDSAYRLVWRK